MRQYYTAILAEIYSPTLQRVKNMLCIGWSSTKNGH
jgi:hypothetical protein